MKDHGYDLEFAVGVTAASATLGPIIPPSLPFVIYAMFANGSVGALFLAGILPGVVMALLMMATVAFSAQNNLCGEIALIEACRHGFARAPDRGRLYDCDLVATQQGDSPCGPALSHLVVACRGSLFSCHAVLRS